MAIMARFARTSARRQIVVAWAQKRFAHEYIQAGDIHIDRSVSQRDEVTRFLIRVNASHMVRVSVSPRGRVSIVTRR